ncbi:hypothetical protein [Mycobacteroides chelonae]|uniref:hypothetical protein n=1 Tax=Mycobacteroides chelonae TaxID=1774 RepID=UPI0008A85D09|nr:hypothetical protein [Mycobacteroides chelonae]OHU63958.1 hypothetical protein BKG85_10920 [Mycobacteroides chelonae]
MTIREAYGQMASALGWEVHQEPQLAHRASYTHDDERSQLVIDWEDDGITWGWANYTGLGSTEFASAGDELWRAVLWLNWVDLKSAFAAIEMEQQRRGDDCFAQMVSDTWNANRDL